MIFPWSLLLLLPPPVSKKKIQAGFIERRVCTLVLDIIGSPTTYSCCALFGSARARPVSTSLIYIYCLVSRRRERIILHLTSHNSSLGTQRYTYTHTDTHTHNIYVKPLVPPGCFHHASLVLFRLISSRPSCSGSPGGLSAERGRVSQLASPVQSDPSLVGP